MLLFQIAPAAETTIIPESLKPKFMIDIYFERVSLFFANQNGYVAIDGLEAATLPVIGQ